jgi:hypothetical protein
VGFSPKAAADTPSSSALGRASSLGRQSSTGQQAMMPAWWQQLDSGALNAPDLEVDKAKGSSYVPQFNVAGLQNLH